MDWGILFYTLFASLAAWILYQKVRHNPDLFSKDNFSKTASTLGFLALSLIAFMIVCVWLLKQQ